MLRVLLNAAIATHDRVGITLWIQRVLQEISRVWRVTVATSAPEVFDAPGLNFVQLPAGTHRHSRRLSWTMGSLPGLARGFDVLICPCPEVPVLGRIVKLAVVHDLTPLRSPRTHSAAYKAFFALGLASTRFADGIVADSTSTALDYARFKIQPKSAVRVALPGAGIATQTSPTGRHGRDDQLLLYVGGHAPHKNLRRLLAAVAIVRQTIPIRLIIVGWGKDWQVTRTRRDISRYGLDGCVNVAGRLSDTELSQLYSGCTAFVLPSLYEGFGLPLLEAMKHGAPAACSRVSSLPEVGGEAVLYFDPHDSRDIDRQLTRLLSDATTCDLLAARAIERSAAFTWRRTAAEIVEFSEYLHWQRSRRTGPRRRNPQDASNRAT